MEVKRREILQEESDERKVTEGWKRKKSRDSCAGNAASEGEKVRGAQEKNIVSDINTESEYVRSEPDHSDERRKRWMPHGRV